MSATSMHITITLTSAEADTIRFAIATAIRDQRAKAASARPHSTVRDGCHELMRRMESVRCILDTAPAGRRQAEAPADSLDITLARSTPASASGRRPMWHFDIPAISACGTGYNSPDAAAGGALRALARSGPGGIWPRT